MSTTVLDLIAVDLAERAHAASAQAAASHDGRRAMALITDARSWARQALAHDLDAMTAHRARTVLLRPDPIAA